MEISNCIPAVYKPQSPHIMLSQQEFKIVQGIRSGHTSKEIARSLDISAYTVESYMSRIKQKLNCRNRAEIIAACFTLGIFKH